MKLTVPVVLAAFLFSPVIAETTSAPVVEPLFFSMDEVDLEQLKWKKRPVVVSADSELDPAFEDQMKN